MRIETYKGDDQTYNFIFEIKWFHFRIALWWTEYMDGPFFYCNYGKEYPDKREDGEKHSIQYGAFGIMINFSWEFYI